MDKKHPKIHGYRDLSKKEIDLINEAKHLAYRCEDFILDLSNDRGTDKRSLAIAKTNIQTGFMWLVSSIAKPEDM